MIECIYVATCFKTAACADENIRSRLIQVRPETDYNKPETKIRT